jgi:NADH dehydrogenase
MGSARPRVVIVGGGFGGVQVARSLARAPVDITLVDRQNHHLFQPLLYQVASAGLSPGDIAAPIRWMLRKQRNTRVLMAEATRVDVPAREVHLHDGAVLPYDYLVLATGTTHSYFGHDDWARHAPGLKTLDEALSIRRRILLGFELAERERDPGRRRQLLTFAVIGGGPTGVEMAGALAEIARQVLHDEFTAIDPGSARVVLIEAGPSLLAGFPASLRDSARRALRDLGVEIWENAAVTRVEDHAVWVGDERVAAYTIIWAAGVQGTAIARTLGTPLDRMGRVIVEEDLSVPGHPEVFVLGDLACFTHQTGQPLPGVAQVAKQGAWHVARVIRRRLTGRPASKFHYLDFGSMATIGRAKAIADIGRLHVGGFVAWLMWLFIHLVWLVGFRSKVSVLLHWASSYITYQRNVRLITGLTAGEAGRPLAEAETAPAAAVSPSPARVKSPA